MRCEHHHSCRNITELLHGVGGNGGNIPKAVFIEIAHRNITQMLRDLNAFSCGSTVTRFALEHCGTVFDDKRSENADNADTKAHPNCYRCNAFAENSTEHHDNGRNF